MVIFSLMPMSVVALEELLVNKTSDSSEVNVEKIGNSACILRYKNTDFLTTEGIPVFYSFQVEVNEAELQSGMHFWLPHPLKPNKKTKLSFYEEKKIYDYTGTASEIGDLFYKTELFERFVSAKKITIKQGSITKKMPSYSNKYFPLSVHEAFQACINNLEEEVKKLCADLVSGSKKCNTKKVNTAFSGLRVRDNPIYVAKLKRDAEEEAHQNAIAESKQRILEENAKKKAIVEANAIAKKLAKHNALIAKEEVSVKKQNLIKQTKQAEVVSIKKAKTMQMTKTMRKYESLSIFSNKVNTPFKEKTYTKFSGNVATSIRSDMTHQRVQSVRFNTSKGVFYYESPHGIDYSKYDLLEFNFKLIKDPRERRTFSIKMDCGAACTSGDYFISSPKLGVWKHYSIKIKDLINQPGSTLDITKVNVPFAILPEWGKQRGIVFMIDNVRLIN